MKFESKINKDAESILRDQFPGFDPNLLELSIIIQKESKFIKQLQMHGNSKKQPKEFFNYNLSDLEHSEVDLIERLMRKVERIVPLEQ